MEANRPGPERPEVPRVPHAEPWWRRGERLDARLKYRGPEANVSLHVGYGLTLTGLCSVT